MAHLTRSAVAIQALWRPFICNHCRLSIAGNGDPVKYQRRGLRTRANHPPRPGTNANVVLDNRVEDATTAPVIEKPQVPSRLLTASAEDGHPAALSSRTTSYTEPEVVDHAQDDLEPLDLEDLEEAMPASEAAGYVPAASWEGLKSFKPSEWDAQAQYKAFNPRVSLREPADVERAVHTSLVEVFALRQAGRPVDPIYNAWESVLDHDDLRAKNARFQPETDGSHTLKFGSEGKRKDIMRKLLKDDIISSEDMKGPAVAAGEPGRDISRGENSRDSAQDRAELDDSWKNVSLADPAIKFAVMKRASQMLGLRVQDPDIMNTNDTAGLIQLFTKKPKPKRLQEQLGKDDQLNGLLNIEMFDKRWTPHHKDVELGREKLIKQELVSRGLAKSTHQRAS